MVILSAKEKEVLVIDLLNKNCSLREIAAKVHVSFTDICRIRKKLAGEEFIDKKKPAKQLSIASQAFQLFKGGNSLVDVAIILDISKDDVIQTYSDYLTLKNMGKVAFILQEYKNNLSTFLSLFDYLRKNNIRWVDAKRVIDDNIR